MKRSALLLLILLMFSVCARSAFAAEIAFNAGTGGSGSGTGNTESDPILKMGVVPAPDKYGITNAGEAFIGWLGNDGRTYMMGGLFDTAAYPTELTAQWAKPETVDSWSALKTRINSVADTGTTVVIKLPAELTADSTIHPTGCNVILIAADTGTTIKNTNSESIFSVSTGGKLILEGTAAAPIILDGNSTWITESGGLLFASGGTIVLNRTTVKNVLSEYNSPLWVNQGGSAVLLSSTFADNSVSPDSCPTSYYYGGAVSVYFGNIYIDGTTFSGNSAKSPDDCPAYGGAINIFESGNVHISSAVFSGNSAQAGGGAINISDASGTLTLHGNTSFSGNKANIGGAVKIETSGTLKLPTGSNPKPWALFTGNNADSAAADVYITSAGATLPQFTYDGKDNVWKKDVSGARADASTAACDPSEYTNSTGALALRSFTAASTSTADIQFVNNTASSGDGGAIRSLGTVTAETAETVTLTVKKTWPNGTAPEAASVVLSVYQGVNNRFMNIVLDGTADGYGEEEPWTAVFRGLPKQVNGTDAAYTVSEILGPDGYTAAVSDGTVSNTGSGSFSHLTYDWGNITPTAGTLPAKASCPLYTSLSASHCKITIPTDVVAENVHFVGWAKTKDATTASFLIDGEVRALSGTAGHILYAVWADGAATNTPTPVTPTNTNTPVPPTNTPTPTNTNTPTNTPVTPTDTNTPTNTPVTPTDTNTPTNTPVTPTDTNTPTNTPVTPTDTNTPTNTPVTPTDTNTPTNTPVTPTDTNTPTNTPVTPTDTNTPTNTQVTPTDTNTPTNTPVTPTDTNTPTNTPVTPTDTNTPTNTPVTPTDTNTPTLTPSPSPTGTEAPTKGPSATPTVRGPMPGKLPETGFSAIHAVTLREKPASVNYRPTGKTLQIPSLGVQLDVLEIPYTDGEYPVTWLGDAVGSLEGFDRLYAAHNHLNTTEAGPFALISALETGTRIFITAPDGSMTIYAVYANVKLSPTAFAAVSSEVDRADSIALITCEDERIEGGYAARRVVFAKEVNSQ